MTTLEGLHGYAIRLAAGEQDKRGECRTQWIVVRESSAVIIETPWGNDLEKDAMLEWLRAHLTADQTVTRFAYVAEAWIRFVDQIDHKTLGDRVDSLIINTQQRDGQYQFTMFKVSSGGGRRKTRTEIEQYFDAVQGSFADMFGAGDTGLFDENFGD